MVKPSVVYISERDLRYKFNTLVQPNIDRGLYNVTEYRRNPPNPRNNQDAGTMSVMFEVTDQKGNHVAIAHAYVRPDGTLAASGKLDPKQVKIGGTFFRLAR